MQALRCSLFCVLFAIVPASIVAQGHRGQDEPKLNDKWMELPAIGESDVVLVYNGFVVNYNTERLVPNWVAYELTAEEVAGDVPRANGFSMDLSYEGKQAMREDYSYSGWDKGHMAPAADMKWSQSAMIESFYLTNVCPQNHELNGGSWHALEKRVRDWAKQYDKVWVVCGPYFYGNRHGTIGERNVMVPDGFFKAVLRQEGENYKSIAFVFENDGRQQPVNKAVVPVNGIEALVGYDLFTNLNDKIEEYVESRACWEEWGK
jgi:endonuclease G